jgi:hypothetical protein
MAEHFILEIMECRISCSDPEWYDAYQYTEERTTYRISTRKLEAWLPDNEFAYGYVKAIVEACLRGITLGYGYASRKYSFGDTPSWWDGLIPDEDCNDPVKTLEYEITLS